MDEVKFVKGRGIEVQTLIDEVKKNLAIDECGAIVCFIGIVRGTGQDGTKVKELHCEADEEKALESMGEIREQILKDGNVKELLIHCPLGTLKPGEETLFIAAAGRHRQNAFNAASQALEEVNRKAPIRRKEVT